MSHFGDGNLSQKILDEINYCKDEETTNSQIIKALAEVIQYFAECESDD